MKIVLDTNVWISGLMLEESNAGKIISAWEKSKLVICTSCFLIEEIGKVLNYPKIKKRLRWDESKINQYLDFLKLFTQVVEIAHIKAEVASDPGDESILATFLASEADYLVSGDNDLLILSKNYPILSPADFCKKFFTSYELEYPLK